MSHESLQIDESCFEMTDNNIPTSKNPLDECKPVLGGLMYLSSFSDLHRNYPISYLVNRVDWSMSNKTYRYYEVNGSPIAFCCWVYTSKQVIDEVMSTGRELEPAELGIDSEVFIMEFIAPFGHAKKIVSDLLDHCFPKGQIIYAIKGRLLSANTVAGKPKSVKFKRR